MERASLRQAFISVFVLKSSRLSVFARDPGLGNSFTLRREGAKRTDTSKDRISVLNLAPWRLCVRPLPRNPNKSLSREGAKAQRGQRPQTTGFKSVLAAR